MVTIRSRTGERGRESASAMEIPPLNPPQVSIFTAPGLNVRIFLRNRIGIPMLINRANITTKTAISPMRIK